MKGFLINPFDRTITEVEYNGTLEHMYELVGCTDIEAVKITSTGDTVWVDGEGLLNDPTHFFYIGDYPQELAGKGLVLGSEAGECVEPKTVTLPLLLRSVAYMSMAPGQYQVPPVTVTMWEK
jgi:hypothetical protein